MQNQGFVIAMMLAAGCAFAAGLLVGRAGRQTHLPYELMLLQEQLQREREAERGFSFGWALFVFLVLIIVWAVIL